MRLLCGRSYGGARPWTGQCGVSSFLPSGRIFMRRYVFASSLLLVSATAFAAPKHPAAPALAAATDQRPLLGVKPDAKAGKIIAILPAPDAEGISGRYIYLTQLETGLGSAPIGLDKAAPSGSRILVFRRIGKKVAAEIENPKFVATNGTADEQKSVRGAFATSTIWMGDVVKNNPDGSFTVDLASFLARDDVDVPRAVKQGAGGDFKFVPELSAADPTFVKVFPRNAEFAAKLTFRSDEAKDEINNIIPDSRTFSLTLRHSLIALPGPGYVPRHDPYGYAISVQQVDFSAP